MALLNKVNLLCRSGLCLALLLGMSSATQAQSRSVKIIEPKKTPEPAKPAMIDTERFQVGGYYGAISVEDFNTNPLLGLEATYQITPNYLLLINYAKSDVSKSTFERSQGYSFLTDDQRELSYWTISGGYRLFKGRSFLGAHFKYDSDIYLIGGVGKMDFAGYNGTGISFGASYRVVFTDWLVATFDIKDHVYEQRDVFNPESFFDASGTTKTNQNIEFSIGVNALF